MAQWVEAMRKRGHDVLLVSPNEPRPELSEYTVASEDEGAPGPFRFPARILRIRRLAKEHRSNVYHAHYATDYAFWLALAGLRPLLVRSCCWGSDVLLRHNALTRFKRLVGLRAADFITATSNFALNRACRIASRRVRSEVIHWGVDTEKFHPTERSERTGKITYLSLRNLYPLYNIDVVVRGFAKAARSDAQLRILGDGPMRWELEALAVSLGVADSVRFLGVLPQQRVAEELGKADVCISVPSSDATAVSNLEAMASGVPLIASALPSTREWVEPGGTGLLVTPCSVDQLADAISLLADDSDRYDHGWVVQRAG